MNTRGRDPGTTESFYDVPLVSQDHGEEGEPEAPRATLAWHARPYVREDGYRYFLGTFFASLVMQAYLLLLIHHSPIRTLDSSMVLVTFSVGGVRHLLVNYYLNNRKYDLAADMSFKIGVVEEALVFLFVLLWLIFALAGINPYYNLWGLIYLTGNTLCLQHTRPQMPRKLE